MVIHVLINISQQATRNNRNPSKRNTRIIHIWIACRIRQLASRDKNLPLGHIAIDARHMEDFVDQARADELCNLPDSGAVVDLVLHARDGDVLCQVGDELVVEDVVVDGIPDCAADNADGQRERRNGGDQVVRTDDGCHDGCRDDNAADAEAGDDEDAVDGVHVVAGCGGECAAASCHHDRGNDHEHAVSAAEGGEEPEDDAGADQDRKADGHTAKANANWVMAVDVERLGGPEEEDGEEVRAGDEGDDQGQDQDAWILTDALGKHGEFGEFPFPDAEDDEEDEAENQWDESVCRLPGVLVTSPEEAGDEKDHAGDRE